MFVVDALYRPPGVDIPDCVRNLDRSFSVALPDVIISLRNVNVNLFNPSTLFTDCFDASDFTQLIDEVTKIMKYSTFLINPVLQNCKEHVISFKTYG